MARFSIRTDENVAVVFPDEAGGTAIVSLFDEIGAVVRSISYDSAVPATLQQSLSAFTTADVPAGRITVTVTHVKNPLVNAKVTTQYPSS